MKQSRLADKLDVKKVTSTPKLEDCFWSSLIAEANFDEQCRLVDVKLVIQRKMSTESGIIRHLSEAQIKKEKQHMQQTEPI